MQESSDCGNEQFVTIEPVTLVYIHAQSGISVQYKYTAIQVTQNVGMGARETSFIFPCRYIK